MACIPYVFTKTRVAELLRVNEEWLRAISANMHPEEGHLRVIGVGEDECPAFTVYGIECLKQIIFEERALLAHQANGQSIAVNLWTDREAAHR